MKQIRAFGRDVMHNLHHYTSSGAAMTRCGRTLIDPIENPPPGRDSRECLQCTRHVIGSQR